MDMTARFNLIREVKMCDRCFHPEVTYSREHEQECSIKEKKSSFSCSKCNRHSWICKNHKEQNKAKLDKFKKDYRDRYKMKLVFTAFFPTSPTTSTTVSAGTSTGAAGGGVDTLPSPAAVTSPGGGADTVPSPVPNVFSHTSTEIGTSRAFKAMKKRLKANGV